MFRSKQHKFSFKAETIFNDRFSPSSNFSDQISSLESSMSHTFAYMYISTLWNIPSNETGTGMEKKRERAGKRHGRKTWPAAGGEKSRGTFFQRWKYRYTLISVGESNYCWLATSIRGPRHETRRIVESWSTGDRVAESTWRLVTNSIGELSFRRSFDM